MAFAAARMIRNPMTEQNKRPVAVHSRRPSKDDHSRSRSKVMCTNLSKIVSLVSFYRQLRFFNLTHKKYCIIIFVHSFFSLTDVIIIIARI